MRTDTYDILLFEILLKFHLVVGLKSLCLTTKRGDLDGFHNGNGKIVEQAKNYRKHYK